MESGIKAIKTGMGSHQSHKMLSDEWLTPPDILEPLGDFDIDPCSPMSRPWPTAKIHYTKYDNGLIQPWGINTRIWLNPPNGQQTGTWLKKLSEHGNGIAMIFARTETKMFFDFVWDKADALLFLKGRIHFYDIDGKRANANAGAPSVLIAYGLDNATILENCGIPGKIVILKH